MVNMLLPHVLPLCNLFFFFKFKTMSPCQKTEAMHAHPRTVIQDLESSACHLQIKHKGYILGKYPYFATLILLAIISPFPQHELISAKKARLQELIGEVEEDEPEERQWWGLVGRPQHTVQVVHPLFSILFGFCTEILYKTFAFLQPILPIPTLFPFCQTILLKRKLPNCKPRMRGTLTLYGAGCRGAFQLKLKRRYRGCW